MVGKLESWDWVLLKFFGGNGIGFANGSDNSHEFSMELEGDSADFAVSVFCDDEGACVEWACSGFFGIGAVDEHDFIGILFDSAGVAEVG